MKRILLLLTIPLLCSALLHAQMRIGILGGFQQSEIRETNDLPNWEELKAGYSKRSGIHLGFLADIPLSEKSNFFFQPAVILSQKGRKYSFARDSTVIYPRPVLGDSIVDTYYSEARKQHLNYIDIPFNLVYKFKLSKKTSFMLGAGPYLSFFFNGSDKTDKYVVGVSYKPEEEQIEVGSGDGKYKLLDWGVNGLAGFEFGRVFLTANYSRDMSNAYQPSGYNASEFKHSVMGIRLGVFLGKPILPEPKDSDKDGVPDKNDQCPDQPGPAENDGCPYTDRDKDGIPDKDDKCPDVPGLARYNGCPAPDSDGDGLTDEEDKCPNEKGTVANNGCPEIKPEGISKLATTAKSVAFKVNKTELTPASFKALDDLARILNDNQSLKLAIEGHTSADGSRGLNMRISKEHPEDVKNYLESKGVAPARLTAEVFGPDKPLNEGRTSEEKAKTRRVELKLSN